MEPVYMNKDKHTNWILGESYLGILFLDEAAIMPHYQYCIILVNLYFKCMVHGGDGG